MPGEIKRPRPGACICAPSWMPCSSHLYGVTDRDDIRYIYSTFPIVEGRLWGRPILRALPRLENALAAGDPDKTALHLEQIPWGYRRPHLALRSVKLATPNVLPTCSRASLQTATTSKAMSNAGC